MGDVDNDIMDGQVRGYRDGVESESDGMVSLETAKEETIGSSEQEEEEGAHADEPPPPPPPRPRGNIVKILRFFDVLKHHYNERPSVYASFMEVIKSYGTGTIAVEERDERVAQMFADAPILVFQLGLLLSPAAKGSDRTPPASLYKVPPTIIDSRRLQLIVLRPAEVIWVSVWAATDLSECPLLNVLRAEFTKIEFLNFNKADACLFASSTSYAFKPRS